MLRTLAALALLASAQAFACPQLTGNYSCTDEKGQTSAMALTQDTKSNVTVYTLNGSDLQADNQARPMPPDADLQNATIRGWCNDDVTLHTELLGKVYQNGQYVGDLKLALDFAMNAKNLNQVASGTIVNGTQTYPINTTITCTPN
jgi:hypothetical protein